MACSTSIAAAVAAGLAALRACAVLGLAALLSAGASSAPVAVVPLPAGEVDAASAADCADAPSRAEAGPLARLACVRAWIARARAVPDRVPAALLDGLIGETLDASIRRADPAHVAAVDALVDELERRGGRSPLRTAARSWVRQLNGRFQEAGSLPRGDPAIDVSVFPRLVPLPAGASASAPRAWDWRWQADGRGGTLVERAIDLAQGARLVVFAAPNCHFCAQAAAEIDADPGLADAVARHASWLIRPFSGLDGTAMQDWQAAHPRLPMAVVLDPAGWPLPPRYGTPHFLFLRDGRVVKTLTGWPPGAVRSLREGLAAIGVAVPPA